MNINLISVCWVKTELQMYMYCTSFTAVIAELFLELHFFKNPLVTHKPVRSE